MNEHIIKIPCRISELLPEHQVVIIRLINHLASSGDLYGQRTIALGEKVDGQTETFDGMNVVVHYMRIPVDMCKCCLENK